MTIKDNPIDTTIDIDEECSFYKDGKCTVSYEEVKRMSLSRCYTCIYNPAKKEIEELKYEVER